MASFARIIDLLPANMNFEKEKIISYAKENIDSCLKYLRNDGLFHNNIDEAETFVETNLSQMISYTIYRGLKTGWLDKNYLNYAEKMRDAVFSKTDEHGFVQGVCGAPHFNQAGRATEGQAFFILMEAARIKYLS